LYKKTFLKYTHPRILKLDISTQASSWQQATVSLASRCRNGGDPNRQRANGGGRRHSSYTQRTNDHLDEATEINGSSAATETWRPTSLGERRALPREVGIADADLVLRAAREPAVTRKRVGTGVFMLRGFSHHVN